jgi:prolipoprotein diacylglyceryl transferase
MTPAKIPSPPEGWAIIHLGFLQIHVYALAILAGIFFAIWLTQRRWVARGGNPAAIEEIAVWAVPLGIIGGRLYHVISSPGPYFGANGHPLDAFKIWNGGLGIWGAVALGSLGALIGARRQHVSFATFMDAAAPGVLIAQAIGRIGNYFNHELFGAPTSLPWGLEVPYDSAAFPRDTLTGARLYVEGQLFHPTFLYEMLWSLAGAALIVVLDRRLRLRFGRVFWLYVVVYTSGRLWIEMLRIDDAVHVAGVRINVWVAGFVLLLGVAMYVGLGRRHAGDPIDDSPAQSLVAPTATKRTTTPVAPGKRTPPPT